MDEQIKEPDDHVHAVNTTVENLRWKKFPVLSDGFVCLVDVMGDDSAIVQAARTSYGKGTKKTSDDRTLIRYLMRHRHSTPQEMVVFKFFVRVPMDCWRQWIRHRMSSTNEYSTRYSEAIDSMDKTDPDKWRMQSTANKQGSGEYLPVHSDSRCSNGILNGEDLTDHEKYLHEKSREIYESRLEAGVAREQARKDLPLSTYTEAYWKIDLHNLFHFLSLRMDPHAQLEIRQYANIIGNEIVAKIVPHAWEAFVDYRLEGMQLTANDIQIISEITYLEYEQRTKQQFLDICTYGVDQKTLGEEWDKERCRERDECWEKLKRLRICSASKTTDNTNKNS